MKLDKGEIVPPNVSNNDLRDEVNRRTAKAGLTTRLGECRNATKIMGTVTVGKEKLNIWPRDKYGRLIE